MGRAVSRSPQAVRWILPLAVALLAGCGDFLSTTREIAATTGFVYSAGIDGTKATVVGYALHSNAVSRVLTKLPASPFFTLETGADDPWDYTMTVDPLGRFLFIGFPNSLGISVFSIQSEDGTLIPVAGSPYTVSTSSALLAVGGLNNYLYAAHKNSVLMSIYSIAAQTGQLTPIAGSPFALAGGHYSIAVDPTGKFVYTGDNSGIAGYAIDGATGELTTIAGSPFPPAHGVMALAVCPSGAYLYAVDWDSHTVTAYALNATTGALTGIPWPPWPAGYGPDCIAIHPSSRFLYIGSSTEGIIAYRIDSSTGVLTKISGSPFFPVGPNGEIDGPTTSIVIDPTGEYAFVSQGRFEMFVFSVNPIDGSLTQMPDLSSECYYWSTAEGSLFYFGAIAAISTGR